MMSLWGFVVLIYNVSRLKKKKEEKICPVRKLRRKQSCVEKSWITIEKRIYVKRKMYFIRF